MAVGCRDQSCCPGGRAGRSAAPRGQGRGRHQPGAVDPRVRPPAGAARSAGHARRPAIPRWRWRHTASTRTTCAACRPAWSAAPWRRATSNAYEAIAALREVYSTHIGYDYDHIRKPEERAWLREAAESRRYRPSDDPDYLKSLLDRLTQVEVFEQFLQRAFPSKYRFSIEGLDMLVPMLDELIVSSAEAGTTNILIGMAHRGRLNVLAHNMNLPYEQILAEFKDPLKIQELRDAIGWTTGDVKYHRGSRRIVDPQQTNGEAQQPLVVAMPPNPSHLELVNPVSVGMARAAGTRDGPARPGRLRPQAHAADPDPRRRLLPRPGRGGRDVQPVAAAGLLDRRHHAHHRQQPARLYDRTRRRTQHPLRQRPGQGLQGARSSTSMPTTRRPASRWRASPLPTSRSLKRTS